MKNIPKKEIELLLLKLRERLQDVIANDEKFDNDFYLYRWLINNHLKVDQTEKCIRESIVWRKANNVDELADQDWGELQNEISFCFGGVTKNGQPITTSNGEDLDIRAILRKFGKEALSRYFIQFFVKLEKLMLDHYKKGPSQHYSASNNRQNSNDVNNSYISLDGILNPKPEYNSSWFSAAPIHIVTYKNFSLWNATCIEGVHVLVEGAKIGVTYFPSCLSSAYVVNLNRFSNMVLKMIKPLISIEAYNLEFFDTDQTKWSKVLLDRIDSDQLNAYFGGTKRIFD